MESIFENVQNKPRLSCHDIKNNRAFNSFLFLLISLLTVLASALLARAETPLTEKPLDSRATSAPDIDANIRRLLLLNECRGCDLTGVMLRNTNLAGADLRNAILRGSDLSGSCLRLANLEAADLTGSNLSEAVLIKTNLANAQLDWVNFSSAWLDTVSVTDASMSNLNLTGARLHNTPISVGGYEQPWGTPHEPTTPFEETQPPITEYDFLLTPPR